MRKERWCYIKEIIEYLLAALVIVSVIPIYNVIITRYYAPPPKSIEPLTLYYYVESINNALYTLANQGNLTPEIISFNEVLNQYMGNLSRDYGYNVEIISDGIVNISLSINSLKIITSDKGNLSILIVYYNLSYETYTLPKPNYTVGHNYVYEITGLDASDIIAVAALLETGVARYYDDWVSDTIYKAYIININGEVNVLIPTNYPKPTTFDYQGYDVINTSIYYYSQQSYYRYNYLWYRYVKDAYYYVNWWTGEPYRKILYVNESEVNYLAEDIGTISINNNNYYVFKPCVFHWERQYYEDWRYIGNVWELYRRRPYLPPYLEIHSLSFPIYNSVFIILLDTAGNIYVARPYRHSMFFGEDIPSDWPVITTNYLIRLGMVDYNIKVTVWRRSM